MASEEEERRLRKIQAILVPHLRVGLGSRTSSDTTTTGSNIQQNMLAARYNYYCRKEMVPGTCLVVATPELEPTQPTRHDDEEDVVNPRIQHHHGDDSVWAIISEKIGDLLLVLVFAAFFFVYVLGFCTIASDLQTSPKTLVDRVIVLVQPVQVVVFLFHHHQIIIALPILATPIGNLLLLKL
jgi:hypothetical protein